ncbi:MAG: DUF4403 family protein [Nitrospira sp.]|nr:DUF4403 family protein [Nitrospira sp.]MDH4371209.1 DUF4403 family protein [Nitrospira sp.]MDH5348452.1 DUF4403 family protein [Nitrospira sp.]MDH5498907.1 DUF4403 family protein [Nitrospira sp.]MDH5726025.1 DUF4403 family protein [Nitrospira sp.]
MLSNSRHRVVIALSFLLSLTSCSDTDFVVRPPAPEKLSTIESPVVGTTDSVIGVPVQLDLSPFLQAVNDQKMIPKKFDHWGSFIKHPKGVEYKYYAERDDFSIERSGSQQMGGAEPGESNGALSLRDWWKGIDLSGASLSVSAPLRYKIGLHPHSQIGDAPAQCGDGSEWPKQATLKGSIAMAMMPNYGVSASLRDVTVNPVDLCKLRVADMDVYPVVSGKLEDHVKGGLSKAVAQLNALTVRSHAEDVWSVLRNPIPLELDVWLLLNIDKVKHGGFSGDGHVVHDTLQITANPVIVYGAEPSATPITLPQIETEPASPEFRGVADVQGGYSGKQSASNRFHVLSDTQVDYSTLSKSLSNRLRGKRVANKGNFIQMTGATISSLGADQVLLRVDFTGDARGHVYLIGKPEINAMTQTVFLSGLRYDAKTTHLLQTAVPDWFYHAPLREAITPELVFGVTPMTDRVRDLLKTGLNRTLSPTVSIQGTVTSMQGVAVFANVDTLRVRTMSDGTLNVTVDNKP